MDAENSHSGKGPVPHSTLASKKATCEAHFYPSDKSGPEVPCEVLAVYLPTLLAPAGAFAEFKNGGNLEDPGRLRHRIQLLSGSPDAPDVERSPFPAAGESSSLLE